MYYKKGVYRGDIVLSEDIKAVSVGKDWFNLVTEKKTYYFKVFSNDDADDWVKKINKAAKHWK